MTSPSRGPEGQDADRELAAKLFFPAAAIAGGLVLTALMVPHASEPSPAPVEVSVSSVHYIGRPTHPIEADISGDYSTNPQKLSVVLESLRSQIVGGSIGSKQLNKLPADVKCSDSENRPDNFTVTDGHFKCTAIYWY